MKTKLTLLTFLVAAFAQRIMAQEGDCANNFSIFVEYAKTKNYEAAYTPWLKTRKECPKYHQATYIYGEKILKDKIDNAADAKVKKTFIDDLLAMYDEFDKNFPDNNRGSAVDKVMLMMENNIGTDQEHYDMLHAAYPANKANFSAKATYAYFSLFVDQYTAGNKGIELQDVFDRYDDLNEQLQKSTAELEAKKDELIVKQETSSLTKKEERNFNAYETNISALAVVTSSMDGKISQLSSCDQLIPFYQKNFDAHKTDAVWLQRAAQRMDAKDCTKDPMFVTIAEALHKLNPTADSAYNIGVAALNQNDKTKAIDYFNQSADLQTDITKKAKTYYLMATLFTNSNPSKARSYAQKALSVKPSYGKAHLFIAQLYASSVNDCGNNPFDKRAVYWLAADTAEKAGRVDSSMSGAANSTAASYRKSAPSKSEIFQAAKQGQTIKFDCWIGLSVKVPNL